MPITKTKTNNKSKPVGRQKPTIRISTKEMPTKSCQKKKTRIRKTKTASTTTLPWETLPWDKIAQLYEHVDDGDGDWRLEVPVWCPYPPLGLRVYKDKKLQAAWLSFRLSIESARTAAMFASV